MIKRKCSLFYVLSVFCDTCISAYTQQHWFIIVCFFYMWCVVITAVVYCVTLST